MNEQNEAQEYAQHIADEVRALDAALSGGEGAADALKSLEMDDLVDHGEDPFSLWVNETVLDVSVRVDVRGYDHGATVIVLRTCGGPRCEVAWDSHDGPNVEVFAWWGHDQGRVRLYVPNLVARFDELAGLHHVGA